MASVWLRVKGEGEDGLSVDVDYGGIAYSDYPQVYHTERQTIYLTQYINVEFR